MKFFKKNKELKPYKATEKDGKYYMMLTNSLNGQEFRRQVFEFDSLKGVKKALKKSQDLSFMVDKQGGSIDVFPLEWSNFEVELDFIMNKDTWEKLKLIRKYQKKY